MKLHEQLSRRLGLTRAEIAAISVLLMLFILGTAVGSWKQSVPEDHFLRDTGTELDEALVDSLLAEARKPRQAPVTPDAAPLLPEHQGSNSLPPASMNSPRFRASAPYLQPGSWNSAMQGIQRLKDSTNFQKLRESDLNGFPP